MLILFDIDGTLLLTKRAGLRAMQAAACELYGEHVLFEKVEFAGRLDPLIWGDIARRHDIDPDAEHEKFRAAYARHLRRVFDDDACSRLLEGVKELVETLNQAEGVTLGLLTGNYPETGRMKIEAAGMDPGLFPVCAWGDDGGARDDLPPVAMKRYQEQFGTPIEPQRVIVIGDTIYDVKCAHAHDCQCLAVATGPAYGVEELAACGAERVVADLSDTEGIFKWLLEVGMPISE